MHFSDSTSLLVQGQHSITALSFPLFIPILKGKATKWQKIPEISSLSQTFNQEPAFSNSKGPKKVFQSWELPLTSLSPVVTFSILISDMRRANNECIPENALRTLTYFDSISEKSSFS